VNVFCLLVDGKAGGCPASGRRQAAGSWERKRNLGAFLANEGFWLLVSGLGVGACQLAVGGVGD